MTSNIRPMVDDPRLPERFWAKVSPEPNTGCFLWAGAVDRKGYGQYRAGSRRDGTRRTVRAHRLAYEELVGPIPEGLQIDHLCRVRCCVNPAHLEPVTNRENVRRGDLGTKNTAKTHCPAGHPYDEANTRRSAGKRRCRACDQARQRACRARARGPRTDLACGVRR